MDKTKEVAGDAVASGKKHLGHLFSHGPGAVKDGYQAYVKRVGAGDDGASLPSWNDTDARRAIVEFVHAVTEKGGSQFVPRDERVAIFDNDGTLWPEKPIVIQLAFTISRWAQQAEADPSLRDQQPYKSAYEHDMGWLDQAMIKHYQGDDADLALLLRASPRAFEGLSIEQYQEAAKAFFLAAQHPTLKRPFSSLGYQPMIELIRYLEAHDFTVYIASGGDRDFMRSIAGDIYGIPPERVVGSSQKLEFRELEDRVDVLYKADLEFFDDGPEKPVRIWSRIGRRPILVGGNSNGDIPMMRFANVADRPSLRVLVHHDDDVREFAYDGGAEDALARAAEHNWTVVSMKNDWSVIFSGDKPAEAAPAETSTPDGTPS